MDYVSPFMKVIFENFQAIFKALFATVEVNLAFGLEAKFTSFFFFFQKGKLKEKLGKLMKKSKSRNLYHFSLTAPP